MLSVVAIILAIWVYGGSRATKLKLEILVDGQLSESMMLDKDDSHTINLDTGNVICVENGYVYMKSAKCPDGLCVKQGKIDKIGESIICLPHKVVVRLVKANNEQINDETLDDGLDVMPR